MATTRERTWRDGYGAMFSEQHRFRLMCVLAHPDYESLGMGGALAKCAAEGVDVVSATKGNGDSREVWSLSRQKRSAGCGTRSYWLRRGSWAFAK